MIRVRMNDWGTVVTDSQRVGFRARGIYRAYEHAEVGAGCIGAEPPPPYRYMRSDSAYRKSAAGASKVEELELRCAWARCAGH